MPITSMSLSNFQCFGTEVSIPLAPLTFLFGPNSAGKSAVLDALEILRDIIRDSEPDSWEPKLLASVRTGSHDMKISVEMHRGKRFSRPDKTFSLFDAFGDKSVSVSFRFSGFNHAPPSFEPDFYFENEVLLDGVILMKRDQRGFCLNLGHTFFLDWQESKELADILISRFGRRVVQFVGDPLANLSGQNFGNVILEGKSDSVIDDQAIDLFKTCHDQIKGRFIENFFKLGVTPASRGIPCDSNLTYLVEAGKEMSPAGYIDFSKTKEDDGFSSFQLPNSGDPLFRSIAVALAATLDDYTTWSAWERQMEEEDGPFWQEEWGESLSAFGLFPEHRHWALMMDFVENVQRTLSEYVFCDVGYQIGFDHRVLMDRMNLERILSNAHDDGLPLVTGKHPILVRIFLVDKKGRKLSFSDVGSGLAYVLPVVLEVWNPQSYTVFIQQPELHLHPALQSPIADLLIEARHKKYGLIVETHSEHIILRVLKRIRQTTGGHPLAEELHITPDEVAVLYFDPGADGTTKVKRLRITPDGDFMDRWPRGFFAERDQELFDE